MSGHERERLSAYLDGELPADERAAVEAHLAACPECATGLAELAAADEAAARLPAEAPEGYFDAFPSRVRARLARAASPGRRVPAWTWAVAAALLLAVVTPLTLRELRTTHREAPSIAPAAVRPAPAAAEPKVAAEPRRSEPAPIAPAARPAAPTRDRAVTPAPAPRVTPQENETAGFAREPAPPARPLAAQAIAARAEAEAPPPGAAATEESSARGGEPGKSAVTDAAAAGPAAPARSAEKGRLAGPASAERPTPDARFRRLEAARPRSAAEWRRLRDEWNAVAAAQADPLRADEARVRAIEAGREAWRSGGEASDEDAFRRDAAAYLRREDALQKPRVERLLAEAGPGRAP